MMTSLLLAAALGDTTLTVTATSRDMQLGRDKAMTEVRMLTVTGACKTTEVLDTTLKLDGARYVWTVTVRCTRP